MAWGFAKRPKACFGDHHTHHHKSRYRPLIGSNEISDTYDELLAKSSLAWASRWNESDIEIDGAPDDQSAVRYNIFQLITSCSARDSSVSIGARGLTHTRYKGCYFWDTDLFMLSFFLYTHPEAAKSLMEYRVRTLPQAKRTPKDEQCRRSVSLDDIFRRF